MASKEAAALDKYDLNRFVGAQGRGFGGGIYSRVLEELEKGNKVRYSDQLQSQWNHLRSSYLFRSEYL
tara:strand:+ start:600 stop:803 length:204 start_codon:yes stop_codon:yes gene_type:complete